MPKTCEACQRPDRLHTVAELREHHPGSNPECATCLSVKRHSREEYEKFHLTREYLSETTAK